MNAYETVAGALVAAAVLAGCGGSSSDTSTPPPPPPPTAISTLEGVYHGTVSEGSEQVSLVLENGQFYSMYGSTAADGIFHAYGVVQGSGTATTGSFSSTDAKDFFRDGTSPTASVSATFSPTVSFNGTVTEGTTPFTFTSAPLAASLYNYKTAASIADIAGAWTMASMQDESFDLTISSAGAVTGTSASGCSLTGTVTPRPSGKNVFNVSLTFGAAPCTAPGQSASGIGIQFALADGRHELLVAGTDTDRATAMIFAGAR